ncbi:hypothetical protein [Halobacillus sp. KGW1]|uniref:hypothetical protein n=1 Tax=Halobacillus sp. KGW1 TaxID=1793726 RepID=UPI0007823F64|nr:hypothetical protein [Halobacillus sp. KGW1]
MRESKTLSYYKQDILDSLKDYFSSKEAEEVLFKYMQIIDAMEEDVPPKQLADRIYNHSLKKEDVKVWLRHIRSFDEDDGVEFVKKGYGGNQIIPYKVLQDVNKHTSQSYIPSVVIENGRNNIRNRPKKTRHTQNRGFGSRPATSLNRLKRGEPRFTKKK